MSTHPRYTLVICTCDIYKDAWDPLFTLFQRYWPGLDVPIVLNTETAVYQHQGYNIICPQLYNDHPNPQSVPWSERLRNVLTKTVSTELVMLFLDDFYLRSPVNSERVEICLRMIEEQPTIANIQLFTCPRPFVATKEYPWLVKRSKKAPYLFSLQAGFWRKSRLLHFLRDHESPWYFERWGSLRGRRYPDEFYALYGADGKQPIFDYWPSMQGISQGLWRPRTSELFAKEGISLDLSIRGVMPLEWKPPNYRRNWFRSAWNIFRSLRP